MSSLEEALTCLGRDPEVQSLALFGSRARGDARRDSDLDLLLILQGTPTPERENSCADGPEPCCFPCCRWISTC